MLKRMGIVLLAVLAMLAGVAAVAQGAGFALYEYSARGNALGGTLVGRADDPSAVAFNPAGMTQLPGSQAMAGVTFIKPAVDVDTEYYGDYSGNSDVWTLPHGYFTQQISDRFWFGLGLYSRFGLGTEFEDDWAGRYNVYQAQIKSLSVNPNIAFEIIDGLSVAVGVEAMWFEFTQRKKVDATGTNNPNNNPDNDIRAKLKGDSLGWGLTAGVHYKPTDWLSLGLSYKSQMEQEVSGRADFTKPSTLPLPPSYFEDTDARGKIILPDMFFSGIAVKPLDNLSVEAGVVWTLWSTYNNLTIKYDNDILPGVDETVSQKKWNNTFRYQLGVEWNATDWLDVRGGYIYDQTPIDDEHVDYMVPANNRHLFSGGLGFHWDDWTIDASYTYLLIEDRNDVGARPTEGIVDSSFKNGDAHLFGLSLSYKF